MAFLLAYTHTISAGKSVQLPPEFKSETTIDSMCCKDSNRASLDRSVYEYQSFSE